jgi:hypothetical protein
MYVEGFQYSFASAEWVYKGSVLPYFLVSDRHYDLFHLYVLNHTLISNAFVRNFTKCFWVSWPRDYISQLRFFIIYPQFFQPYCSSSISNQAMTVPFHILSNSFVMLPFECYVLWVTLHLFSSCNLCRQIRRDYAHCYRHEFIPLPEGNTYHEGYSTIPQKIWLLLMFVCSVTSVVFSTDCFSDGQFSVIFVNLLFFLC